MCVFVQWQIFVCAVGILHEADLGNLGIKHMLWRLLLPRKLQDVSF